MERNTCELVNIRCFIKTDGIPGPLVANAEPGAVLLQREVDDFAAACAEAEASINRFFLM